MQAFYTFCVFLSASFLARLFITGIVCCIGGCYGFFFEAVGGDVACEVVLTETAAGVGYFSFGTSTGALCGTGCSASGSGFLLMAKLGF